MKVLSIKVTKCRGHEVTAKVVTDTYFATTKTIDACCAKVSNYLESEWLGESKDPRVRADITVFPVNPDGKPIEIKHECYTKTNHKGQ
jgi:hypothetical protein